MSPEQQMGFGRKPIQATDPWNMSHPKNKTKSEGPEQDDRLTFAVLGLAAVAASHPTWT